MRAAVSCCCVAAAVSPLPCRLCAQAVCRCCCYAFRLSRSDGSRLFPFCADVRRSASGSACPVCVRFCVSGLRSGLACPVLRVRSAFGSALLSALSYALALSRLVIADLRRIVVFPRLLPRPRSAVACCAYYSVTWWAAARYRKRRRARVGLPSFVLVCACYTHL